MARANRRCSRFSPPLLSPDSGAVRIGGIDIFKDPLQARRTMDVMPEDLGLFDSLTIEEHLELSGPIYGLSARETRERDRKKSKQTFTDGCPTLRAFCER
jgi:ABC-type Na+ transport system ATPase subunit NatA